jgi:hypothetical protein
MLNLSIITACVPLMKPFLDMLQFSLVDTSTLPFSTSAGLYAEQHSDTSPLRSKEGAYSAQPSQTSKKLRQPSHGGIPRRNADGGGGGVAQFSSTAPLAPAAVHAGHATTLGHGHGPGGTKAAGDVRQASNQGLGASSEPRIEPSIVQSSVGGGNGVALPFPSMKPPAHVHSGSTGTKHPPTLHYEGSAQAAQAVTSRWAVPVPGPDPDPDHDTADRVESEPSQVQHVAWQRVLPWEYDGQQGEDAEL